MVDASRVDRQMGPRHLTLVRQASRGRSLRVAGPRIAATFRQRPSRRPQWGMRFSARGRRAARRFVAVSALTLGAYGALLFAPAPLFRYAHAGTAITVHSDAP